MAEDGAIDELKRFVTGYRDEELIVHRASLMPDERQDGEAVTRVVLLLNEPTGDTWDVDRVRRLRTALGRKATELGLPPVSVTLVPQSEAELVDAFSR